MTHKPNRTNLPPAKSADEYERELAALRARVEDLETALRKIACSRGPLYFDPQEPGPETEVLIYFIIELARAALSPKGEA